MADETQRAAIIGVVTASDRASAGLYEDQSGPAIVAYLTKILKSPFHIVRKIIPDGFESVRDTLIELADKEHCDLILTTGGTGPSPRDLTPEATLAAAPRELPGFGELMRQESLKQVPTAILSRQIAAHRGPCLVINLPGKPASIETCLNAVFPAVPYCLDLIGAATIETDAGDPQILPAKPPSQAAWMSRSATNRAKDEVDAAARVAELDRWLHAAAGHSRRIHRRRWAAARRIGCGFSTSSWSLAPAT